MTWLLTVNGYITDDDMEAVQTVLDIVARDKRDNAAPTKPNQWASLAGSAAYPRDSDHELGALTLLAAASIRRLGAIIAQQKAEVAARQAEYQARKFREIDRLAYNKDIEGGIDG